MLVLLVGLFIIGCGQPVEKIVFKDVDNKVFGFKDCELDIDNNGETDLQEFQLECRNATKGILHFEIRDEDLKEVHIYYKETKEDR